MKPFIDPAVAACFQGYPAAVRKMVRLFVYGTLKEGFPNHHFNAGRRLPGIYRTKKSFPLLVVQLPSEDRAPWLIDLPGDGYQVLGQVFELDAASLPVIDKLEEVGLPTGYIRVEIELESVAEDGAQLLAFAYLKPEHHLPQCLAREGPFNEYTLQLAEGYRLAAG